MSTLDHFSKEAESIYIFNLLSMVSTWARASPIGEVYTLCLHHSPLQKKKKRKATFWKKEHFTILAS